MHPVAKSLAESVEEYAPNELPHRKPLAMAYGGSMRDNPPQQLPTSVPPHTVPADSYVTYLLSSLCSHLRLPNAFLAPPAAKGTTAMASTSSQVSEPPSFPPRTPPREHRSLKRRPFKNPEATPRAARRSMSIF